VKNFTSSRFWKAYEALPDDMQRLADSSFLLLESNPSHPSLHFKKVGDFWSARVGLNYRALAVEEPDGLIWVWIGPHDEYERLIRKGK
jgi:hypothetical protein